MVVGSRPSVQSALEVLSWQRLVEAVAPPVNPGDPRTVIRELDEIGEQLCAARAQERAQGLGEAKAGKEGARGMGAKGVKSVKKQDEAQATLGIDGDEERRGKA
jgi:flavodoxin